jgi:hypothetical protein
VLTTVGPHLGGARWIGAGSLGRTCGIAVAALCADLRPDCGGDGAGLVAQLCSFVLGPDDAAAIDLTGEIVGELCDITGSCFVVLQEEKSLLFRLGVVDCKEPAFELPLIDERGFLDHVACGVGKDEIDDKVAISENLKGSEPSAEQYRQSEAEFVLEMEAEEEVVIQEQGLISSDEDHAIVEKRLECDPVSVEIKKCEPVQSVELEVKKCELVQAMVMEIKKCKSGMEVKDYQPVEPMGNKAREPVKSRSSIAQRIKLWEARASGNFKDVIEDMENIPVKIKDVKRCVDIRADLCVQPCDHKLKAQDISSKKESVEQEHSQEFKDVKECVPLETEICNRDLEAEENAPASHSDQVPKDVRSEAELQEQECRAAQSEQDMQECQVAQPEQDIQEMEEYKDVTESPVMCNERHNSLKSTSIAGRAHWRTSSENLVSEGSPSQKEKEWKRTLACKLYEERMQLRLCRDRAVVEGSDNMDILWEAYEVGSSGGSRTGVKQSGKKLKSSKKVEELVEEDEEVLEEQDNADAEGSVRQLCCLQALKFSTKKMGFGGGKPSLTKISKVLKRMTMLSRVGSRCSQKG